LYGFKVVKAGVSDYAAEFLYLLGWKACEAVGLVSGVVVPEVDFLGYGLIQFEAGELFFAVIGDGYEV